MTASHVRSGPDLYTNRIVGYGEVAVADLIANPKNWRRHPPEQLTALDAVLRRVGIVQNVLVNRRTGGTVLIDGHARVVLARKHGVATLPVSFVDLDEAEEDLILLTFDPLGALAGEDAAVAAALRDRLAAEDRAVFDLLAREDGAPAGEDTAYSRKVEPPIYRPTGPKPDVTELVDETKTQKLLTQIQAAEGITEEERSFLTAAARRHTVFSYGKIAEYYAHADAALQALMEESALVIIDFGQAIELGFVRLSRSLAEQVADEYPDE